MPSVRIEDDAFGDIRYQRLAAECGLADSDHALGKMARLWRQCTAENSYHLDPADVIAVLGPRAVDGLAVARLGSLEGEKIRIRGTRGRIEWLETLRENGRKGGRPKREPSGSLDLNPLAPSPALDPVTAPAHEKKKIRSGARELAPDWEPNAKHSAYAEANGINLAVEVQRFRNHADQNARTVVRWDAAFSNWLIGAYERRNGAKRGAAAAFDLAREEAERERRGRR